MDGNAMLFFDKHKKLERLISFINESMKSGNDVYLSWGKIPDDLDLNKWHSIHDKKNIAEVQGYYHDGIVVEFDDKTCFQVGLFRLFHEANDFHLYEVITVCGSGREYDDSFYNKITLEMCVKNCIINDTDIALI